MVRQTLNEWNTLAVDFEYWFAGANDGRLWQRKDWATGEEILYSYDALGRLSTAATTSAAWGLSWSYDGFGNRLQQSVTKGSAPVRWVAVDGLTNRMIGQSYDANGNLGYASQYDVENRRNDYWYSASNQRLLSKTETQVLWMYGIDGELLGQFELRVDPGDPAKRIAVIKPETERIYGGGRLLQMGGLPVSTDRLGSVVRHGTANLRYYPYGEEMGGATTQNFAPFTYTTQSMTLREVSTRQLRTSPGASQWSYGPGYDAGEHGSIIGRER